MFPGKQINVPIILQGPSMYTSADESKDLSDVASQMGTRRAVLEAKMLQLCGRAFGFLFSYSIAITTARIPCFYIALHSVQRIFWPLTALRRKQGRHYYHHFIDNWGSKLLSMWSNTSRLSNCRSMAELTCSSRFRLTLDTQVSYVFWWY